MSPTGLATSLEVAKYVQLRLPLSRMMLRALEAYLREQGWREAAPHVFERGGKETLRVAVPRAPFSPTVIDAALEVAAIIAILAIQKATALDTIIAEVAARVGLDKGVRLLNLRDHQCFIDSGGCVFYAVVRGDTPEIKERLLHLWPDEVLELAAFIEASCLSLEGPLWQLETLMRGAALAFFSEIEPTLGEMHAQGMGWTGVRDAVHARLMVWCDARCPLFVGWSPEAVSRSAQGDLLLQAFGQVYREHYPEALAPREANESERPFAVDPV